MTVNLTIDHGRIVYMEHEMPCRGCRGKKRTRGEWCRRCAGLGWVPTWKLLEMKGKRIVQPVILADGLTLEEVASRFASAEQALKRLRQGTWSAFVLSDGRLLVHLHEAPGDGQGLSEYMLWISKRKRWVDTETASFKAEDPDLFRWLVKEGINVEAW